MGISFNQIGLNILTPGQFVEFDSSRAISGLPKPLNRTLIFGQKLATGSKANNTLIRVNTADEAKQFFGRGSMIARMVEFYKANEPNREVWCVGLNDAVGTAATATITVNSAPTAAGTIELVVAGIKLSVPVASNDTVATVATNIAAAVNAALDAPFTAAAVAAVVTLTARHKGTIGNQYDIRDSYTQGQSLPTSLGLTYTAFTGGATDPDVTQVFTAIGDNSFKTIVTPFTDATSVGIIKTNIAAAINGMVQNDSYYVGASIATLTANQTLGGLRNEEFGTIVGAKGVPNASYEFAATYAAAIAASEDADPGRPFKGLVLTGILAPKEADRHTRQERQYLLVAGISTIQTDASGNVIIDRAVSTYKTNAQGLPDTSYQDLNVILVLYYIRWSLRYRIATKYPRHKLGDDSVNYASNTPLVTPKTIKAEIISWAREMEAAGLIENFNQFKNDLVVERDAADRNRVNVQLAPDLINQFQIFAAQIQFKR